MSFLQEFLRTRASEELVDVITSSIDLATQDVTGTHLAHLVDTLLDSRVVTRKIPVESIAEAKRKLGGLRSSLPGSNGRAPGFITFDLKRLAETAVALAGDWGTSVVSPLTMLATCLAPDCLLEPDSLQAQEILRASGITLDSLLPVDRDAAQRADYTYQSLGFGTDLTAKARAGAWPRCPLIGMDRELRRLSMALSAGADSIVLVGEPGVGKSALMEGLAYHMATATPGLITPDLERMTIVEISTVSLLSGCAARGELEERLQTLLKFFRENPLVVPFFDEIHTLLDPEDPTARSIATALKPPMGNGMFRCIGATTDKEYAQFVAGGPAMDGRFTKVVIQEPDEDTAVEIVKGAGHRVLGPAAVDLGVDLSDDAVRAAVRITGRYDRNERLPRKAFKLLKHVASSRVYAVQLGDERRTILPDDVRETFSEMRGIPLDELDDSRQDFYEALKPKLARKVRGQPAAIDVVTSRLTLHVHGWVDRRRPRGRFLFLGPPGVGKTHLAREIADLIMSDRGSLVVKNMAEFQGESARTRWMGADPGYKGYGETHTVYQKILMRPYSVVVLDEFEKAHASLANPLISMLDGFAEDAQGRPVDFSQCIFVLTSNACPDLSSDTPEEEIRQALRGSRGIWQAPLVDRIDGIVVFRPLDHATLEEILDMLIEQLRSQATHPLPATIDDPHERARILLWATQDGAGASARRLERSLLRWLSESSKPNADEINAENPIHGARLQGN